MADFIHWVNSMKTRFLFSAGLTAVFLLAGCDRNKSVFDAGPFDKGDFTEVDTAKAVYAGVRSSSYGIDPFPEPEGWQAAVAARIDQQCGIFRVDFTLRDVLPTS